MSRDSLCYTECAPRRCYTSGALAHTEVTRMDAKTIARFWSKVDKDGPMVREELGPCWAWTASKTGNGYGGFYMDGKPRRAHRVAFEIAHGPIPDGLLVCHRCDVRTCVRDDHLFLGTNTDNMRDAQAKGRLVINHVRGARHPETPFTESDVRAIRAAAASGRSLRGLARERCVNRKAIQMMVKRKTWAHVT